MASVWFLLLLLYILLLCRNYPGEHHDADIVEWLLSFSERWDFRGKQRSTLDAGTGERARWLIEAADLNDRQKRSIEDACIPLGLKGVSAPKLKNYDYIVALGGARMSCLYRTKYAYEILQRDDIEKGEMILLASLRKIADSERNATDTHAPGAETEYDLMCRALEKTADISGETFEQYSNTIGKRKKEALNINRKNGSGKTDVLRAMADHLSKFSTDALAYGYSEHIQENQRLLKSSADLTEKQLCDTEKNLKFFQKALEDAKHGVDIQFNDSPKRLPQIASDREERYFHSRM